MINDPWGKTNEAWLWASCSLRITALQVLSVRIPGEGKWIVSQGIKKNTHMNKSFGEQTVGKSQEESIQCE
jgi:hypothetical protein